MAHVAQKDIVPYIATVESEGSRNNKHYTNASGDAIANEGEMHMKLESLDELDHKAIMATFQAANVTRPLMAVSKICDSRPDTNVRFDSKKALVRRGKRVIATFHRRGGLYVARMRVKRPARADVDPGQGFPRQGVKR